MSQTGVGGRCARVGRQSSRSRGVWTSPGTQRSDVAGFVQRATQLCQELCPRGQGAAGGRWEGSGSGSSEIRVPFQNSRCVM